MKTNLLIILCLMLLAGAAWALNEMTLVEQYVGEGEYNHFGGATAMGDFDADGHDEFIIGAWGWNEERGKNYYYDWDGDWPQTPSWTFQGNTPIWQYDVVDQNLGDINGDGIEDFGLIEIRQTEYARLDLLYGGTSFDSLADWSMSELDDDWFGYRLDSLGDVNGDGGNDWTMLVIPGQGYYGEIRIYFGGAVLDSVSDWRYAGSENLIGNGLGDVNGDGFNDIILLAYQQPPMLFFGGNPMDTIPDLTLPDYSYDYNCAVGDLNDDGFADFSVSLFPQAEPLGRAIYFGGNPIDDQPDEFLQNQWGDPTGAPFFVTHGDMNGDGIDDLITGDAYASYVYLGGPWFNPVPDAKMDGLDYSSGWGREISVGDVNADGRDEILISASNYWFAFGVVFLYTGPAEWIDYGANVSPEDLQRQPQGFLLAQNFPNPFNTSTSIHLELARPGVVNLTVYDLRGNQIKNLISGQQMTPGGYNVSWNGANENQQQVSSGIYLLELKLDQYHQVRKIALLR